MNLHKKFIIGEDKVDVKKVGRVEVFNCSFLINVSQFKTDL